MTAPTRDPNAKLRHIDACLDARSQYEKSAGFERYSLENEAGLPISLQSIDLRTSFCDRIFAGPLMIASMTGGVERGARLNAMWASVAERFDLPMGVGSQRIAIEEGDRAGLFQIRKVAPTAFLFANLGAANLSRENAVDIANRAVDMIEANALFIHFNAMQEACQRADTDFSESLIALEKICGGLKKRGVKVFAREVGFGLSTSAVQRFLNAGVDGLDCAGAGGTSWSKVEAMCATTSEEARMGEVFSEWGIPTAQSILNTRSVSNRVPLIATGGIRSGLDVAKAIALGADMVAMARPMLIAAHQGEESLHRFVGSILNETKTAMFASGALNIAALKGSLLRKTDTVAPSPFAKESLP